MFFFFVILIAAFVFFRLAKKYAYLAINGKSSDDIYLLAKNDIENKKKDKSTRLSGYIAKEDYENARLRNSESQQESSFNFSQFSEQSQSNLISENSQDFSAMKRLQSQTNPTLQNSSSKNNITSAALRENIDSNSAGKLSAHKNFTGRDQSNISPYNSVEKNMSGRKSFAAGSFSGSGCGKSTPSSFKVKRQISFDN